MRIKIKMGKRKNVRQRLFLQQNLQLATYLEFIFILLTFKVMHTFKKNTYFLDQIILIIL